MTKGKNGKDDIPAPGDVTQGAETTPAPEKVQPLTESISKPDAPEADYEALGATVHEVTEGARMPDDGDGKEEPARGRGRPRMSDAERDEAREARRIKDKARRSANAKKLPADSTEINMRAAVAKTNAAMICKVLDVMAAGISAGEYVPSAEQQAATTGVWTAYLYEEGLELPTWVQVSIVSSMHVIPAFATHPGKSKVASLWARAKGWWVTRGA